MYVACFVFLLLWCGYAWVWKDIHFAAKDETTIELKAPILQQTCSTHEVPCVDDCSFLCIEKDSECVGGICETKEHVQDIACNRSTGGVRMMVKDPTPHWKCICSDSRFYGGEACDKLNPDVCEHGTFFYSSRYRYICLCLPPYKLLHIELKPHCIDEKLLNFYDEATMSKHLLSFH